MGRCLAHIHNRSPRGNDGQRFRLLLIDWRPESQQPSVGSSVFGLSFGGTILMPTSRSVLMRHRETAEEILT